MAIDRWTTYLLSFQNKTIKTICGAEEEILTAVDSSDANCISSTVLLHFHISAASSLPLYLSSQNYLCFCSKGCFLASGNFNFSFLWGKCLEDTGRGYCFHADWFGFLAYKCSGKDHLTCTFYILVMQNLQDASYLFTNGELFQALSCQNVMQDFWYLLKHEGQWVEQSAYFSGTCWMSYCKFQDLGKINKAKPNLITAAVVL